MAVYKLFPEQSSTLYSYYPILNSGLDEILELSTFKFINNTNESSRILIKFDQDELNQIIDQISSSNYTASLNLELAYASEIPLNYTIFCYPITGSWNRGTGRRYNIPITSNGVSWVYKKEADTEPWVSGSYPLGCTGSYSGSNEGGGVWITNYETTQSFKHNTSKNINLDVSNIVKGWYNNDIINQGVIIKHGNTIEFNSSSKFETKYFSSETHTIYPPNLEIKWNDSFYSSSLPIVNSNDIVISLGNNQDKFDSKTVYKFRINVRDQYPLRAFQTSSVYLNNKILPSSSYWSLKDLDTEEIIIKFDENCTKISADNKGNYFDLYMNGLQPERYYQIIIKTKINNKEIIISNPDNYFKITR